MIDLQGIIRVLQKGLTITKENRYFTKEGKILLDSKKEK
jgi:hypothetical protein